MKNLISIVFTLLVLAFAHTAQAQDRIVLPDGVSPLCLQHFNELYEDGVITLSDAAALTNSCTDANGTMLGFWNHLYDRFNGDAGPPNFLNMGEVMAALNSCIIHCPGDPVAPEPGVDERHPPIDPPPPPPVHHYTLVVECRGACLHDPEHGIEHGLTGRRWSRHAVCEDGATPLQVEWEHATVGDESLRTVGDDVTLAITYCQREGSPPSAPPIINEVVQADLTDVWRHMTRIEHGCAEHGMRDHSMEAVPPVDPAHAMERSPQWEELCLRYDTVVIHTTQIRQLTLDLAALNVEVDELRASENRRWARQCHHTYEAWMAMSEEQQLAIIGTPQCDAVGTGGVTVAGVPLHFHLGAGLHLAFVPGPNFVLTSPNAIVYGELEALPDPHAGFYLRGFIGGGDLMDHPGQFNPNGTIGAEGIAGGSAGAVIRFDEHFALDLGLASSFGFNPGGQIGETLHGWPWWMLGGEARLRWNPIPLVHVELTGGLADTHTEVLFQGADHMVGSDAVGGTVTLGVGVSF